MYIYMYIYVYMKNIYHCERTTQTLQGIAWLAYAMLGETVTSASDVNISLRCTSKQFKVIVAGAMGRMTHIEHQQELLGTAK